MPRDDGFSSFECTAGSQVFSFPLQATQVPIFPAADAIIMRTCLLRDVCFIGGRLTYFADPELEAALPAGFSLKDFAGALALDGYLQAKFGKLGGPSAPALEFGPRPAQLPFFSGSAATVHALGSLSFAQNWGHMLIDTILPVYAAAQAWGFAVPDVQLLSLDHCDTMLTAGFEGYSELCFKNLQRWVEPLFAHPFLAPPHYHDTCFRQVLVGHNGGLSLIGMYLHRAQAARAARLQLHASLGVAPEPLISAHQIVVLTKAQESTPVGLPDLCALTQGWAAALRPAPPVHCILPAALSPKEQLLAISNATVTLSENGSTGYLSLFQRPGSSFIALLTAEGEAAKEVQVFLYETDVQVFYHTAPAMRDMGEGPGMLLLALERAGKRLGLPRVALAPLPAAAQA